MPLFVGGTTPLWMVPNSLATRSVLTPAAAAELRVLGLAGADITQLGSGRRGCVLSGLSVKGHPLQEMEFQIRDVPEFRDRDDQYLVHGYLGLDFFWTNFKAIRFEFRTARLTFEL